MSNNSEANSSTSVGCGLFSRYPIASVVGSAALGVASIGVGSVSVFGNPKMRAPKPPLFIQWIGLVGDLFIRALNGVVLPLIFANVAVSVVDIMRLGRASSVGVKTIVLCATTTLIASTIGLISILVFKGLLKQGRL